jgi:uncharacterized membrane protein YadS
MSLSRRHAAMPPYSTTREIFVTTATESLLSTTSRVALARWLLPLGGAVCLLPWTPPWAALAAGSILALTVGNPQAVQTSKWVKLLLPVAVIGLGAGIDLGIVARVGLHGLGYTLVGLGVTFALGHWLGRRLAIAPKLTALICAGTGICGGSAPPPRPSRMS